MIIKKQDITVESFGRRMILDYPMPNEEMGISYQEHHGRVPEKGWGVNLICYEVYYVVGGKAKVFIDDKEYDASEGDVVVIDPGQQSYIIADHLKLLTITRPNWNKQQYKEVA